MLSFAFGYVCVYCSRYFSNVACDFPASRYLMALGICTVFLGLVEMYNMCVVNKRDAYAPLDSQTSKSSKIVNIGRMVFGLALLLTLTIMNASALLSKTCRRTSRETAAVKLNRRFFKTLYESTTTLTLILDLTLLAFMSCLSWRQCKDGSSVDEADDSEEKQHLMETTRAGMEAHHAKA